MNWPLFLMTFFASAALVYPGFEIAQRIAILQGKIPPRGAKTWHGRPFLHWEGYKTQLFGDSIFLSLLNAFVAVSAAQFPWHGPFVPVLAVCAVLAAACTVVWLRFVRRAFLTGFRWDWAITDPDAEVTIAGKYHAVYFCFELFIVLIALLYIVWQPIGFAMQFGIVVSCIGYLLTFAYDLTYTRFNHKLFNQRI